jgi:hypothetical protein
MTRNGLIQNADYLKQAPPLIHWPPGLKPRNVDVFIHNEGWIDASPDIVWATLIDASQWPSWYSNSADMRIEGSQPQLGIGASFNWKTFGFPIRSTWMPSIRVEKSAGASIIRYSWFITPGCSCPSAAGHSSSPRKHKRVLVRSGSTSSSRTRCMTVMSTGCPR